MDNTKREFQEADATVDQAVAAFISTIKSISGKWDGVAPVYIVERALLELCDELAKLIDDPGIADAGIIQCARELPGFARSGEAFLIGLPRTKLDRFAAPPSRPGFATVASGRTRAYGRESKKNSAICLDLGSFAR